MAYTPSNPLSYSILYENETNSHHHFLGNELLAKGDEVDYLGRLHKSLPISSMPANAWKRMSG